MSTPTHETFMRRCFDLAILGAGKVSPNPMVGAVLVHEGRIIGEGWHREYGKAHAEVNAVGSVRQEERHLVKNSTLYVSLEPCNIHGNTPPCTDLILREGIKKVVVACLDQTPLVSGNGIKKLRENGVDVKVGVLEKEGQRISAYRNTFAAKNRPFIRLKFAQSQNGFMGIPNEQVWLSNAFSKRLVHKMRSEMDAILVGTQTALTDNPSLTTRHWHGQSPIRIVIDRHLKTPPGHCVFNADSKTIFITEQKTPPSDQGHISYRSQVFDQNLLPNLLAFLASQKITSLLVEGGAATLSHFIEQELWDEAWIFRGKIAFKKGIPSPTIYGKIIGQWEIAGDELTIWGNQGS